MNWKDTTGYSQGESPRVPRTWTRTYLRDFEITITCGHIYHRPDFVMHCRALNIDTKPLTAGIDVEAAKVEAVSIVHRRIEALRTALGECDGR